jgi:hypothetical protein
MIARGSLIAGWEERRRLSSQRRILRKGNRIEITGVAVNAFKTLRCLIYLYVRALHQTAAELTMDYANSTIINAHIARPLYRYTCGR